MAEKETPYLKTLKPKDALSTMLNNANNLPYPLYDLEPSLPRPAGGVRTKVDLTARDQVAKDDFYPFTGQVKDFTYSRIDLKQEFGGMLEGFRLTLPSSTQELLNELTRRTGQEFEVDDVVYETIHSRNSVPYTLKAKRESLRFVGQVDFVLSDVRDLSKLPQTSLNIPAYGKFMAELPLAAPYGNATPWLNLLTAIWPGSEAQTQSSFLPLFRNAVAPLNVHCSLQQSPWQISPTPSAFNLYGAKLVSVDAGVGNYAPLANPNLDRVAVFELSPQYCTNISDPKALLWYASAQGQNPQIRTTSRLRQSGTLNTTDGSAYAEWLKSLTVSSVIRSSPHASMTMEPGVEWSVVAGKLPTNLYGAVVQYNGPRRAQDTSSIYNDLTHVLVVSMDERYNSLWRGNLSFFYNPDGTGTGPALNFDTKVYRGALVNGQVQLTAEESPTWMAIDRPVIGPSATSPTGKVTFDGNGYLRSDMHPAFDLGSADFTVEFVLDMPERLTGQSYAITSSINESLGGPNTSALFFYGFDPAMPEANHGLSGFAVSSVGIPAAAAGYKLDAGQTKISLCRKGDLLSFYHNEQQVGLNRIPDPASAIYLAAGEGITLGACLPEPALAKWKGSISDFRIIKGLSLYDIAPKMRFITEDVTVVEGQTTQVTIGVDKPFKVATQVKFQILGDAQLGREWNFVTGGDSIMFPANVLTHTFELIGIQTTQFNGSRNFILGIPYGPGYTPEYPAGIQCRVIDAP